MSVFLEDGLLACSPVFRELVQRGMSRHVPLSSIAVRMDAMPRVQQWCEYFAPHAAREQDLVYASAPAWMAHLARRADCDLKSSALLAHWWSSEKPAWRAEHWLALVRLADFWAVPSLYWRLLRHLHMHCEELTMTDYRVLLA